MSLHTTILSLCSRISLGFLLLHLAAAHVQLVEPLPRGSLAGTKRAASIQAVDRVAPVDPYLFFPAGDRGLRRNGGVVPGSGKRSQMAAVSSWTDFEPTKKTFAWRAGICGDSLKQRPREHMKNGKYFYDAKISKSYITGSAIDIKVSLNQNHNGFFVFHVCDVSKCGGDINPQCFKGGFCRRLNRAPSSTCNQFPGRCGPIDKRNRDRWYIPCAQNTRSFDGIDNYGFNGELKYYLPKGFICQHCVLHFYHSSANNCLPKGVREGRIRHR